MFTLIRRAYNIFTRHISLRRRMLNVDFWKIISRLRLYVNFFTFELARISILKSRSKWIESNDTGYGRLNGKSSVTLHPPLPIPRLPVARDRSPTSLPPSKFLSGPEKSSSSFFRMSKRCGIRRSERQVGPRD